jgi:exodeoxyribonuclease-3
MKIITWNCAGRFAKTANVLFAENPDIAVIQECLKITISSLEIGGYDVLWFGNEGRKGVAVFCKSNWQMRQIAAPRHNWVIPLHVTGPEDFTLIAVWSCPPKIRSQAYITLIRTALREDSQWFTTGPVILAGDFNSNSKWDKPRTQNHKSLVADLEKLGLASVYHAQYLEAQGAESIHTFHLQWKTEKPFHIDYIFVPKDWLSRLLHFEVGDHPRWSRLSDHRPLIASFGRTVIERS